MRGTKALSVFTYNILNLLLIQFKIKNVNQQSLYWKLFFLMIGLQESISRLKTDGLGIHIVSFN